MGIQVFRRVRLLDGLAAGCLFLLLREWLLPLPALTDTADIRVFLSICAGVLLLDLLLAWRWLAFLLKLAGVLWLLHDAFFATPLFDASWIGEMMARLRHDVPYVLEQNWLAMSLISRNLLFDLMLVALGSLLSYLVLEQRQGLWFVFLTEVYLATLDTFLPYDADGGIIRSLIAGFLLLAILHLRHMEKLVFGQRRNRLAYGKSLVAAVMVIALSVGIAYGAPKQAASWPDPIAYFTGKQGATPPSVKKVGYDGDDTSLGGPFQQDEGLVFVAKTNESYYWRGDAKDQYTGKGWKRSAFRPEGISAPVDYVWRDMLFHGLETKQVKAALRFQETERYPLIFYPGQLKRLTAYTPDNATILYNPVDQHLETHDGTVAVSIPKRGGQASAGSDVAIVINPTLVPMRSYQLVAEVPVISEKKLTEAGDAYPQEIRERYLNLPKDLPPRIAELAREITVGRKSAYEKARAVEAYLRYSGNYHYEMKDVPMPKPEQDFVDQFLFETHRGYCDHFSTAMAVMLRTLGIPTRWVKGFAPGTEMGTDEAGNKIIEVRNKDAHSWVEVYFPGYGWIPFEPTATFTSPVRVENDLVNSTAEQPNVPATIQPQQPKDDGDGRINRAEQDEAESGGQAGFSTKTWAALFLGAAAVLALLWKYRGHLWMWWWKRRLSAFEETRFTDKYGMLLVMFERMLLPRRPGETLREYVHRLSVPGETRQDLWYLTKLYERICYGSKEIGEKVRKMADGIIDRLTRQLKP